MDLAEIRGLMIEAHGAGLVAEGTTYERLLSHMLVAALEVMPEGAERAHVRLVIAAYEDGLDFALARDTRDAMPARARRAIVELLRRCEAMPASPGGAA